jgi:hypothetical protein
MLFWVNVWFPRSLDSTDLWYSRLYGELSLGKKLTWAMPELRIESLGLIDKWQTSGYFKMNGWNTKVLQPHSAGEMVWSVDLICYYILYYSTISEACTCRFKLLFKELVSWEKHQQHNTTMCGRICILSLSLQSN